MWFLPLNGLSWVSQNTIYFKTLTWKFTGFQGSEAPVRALQMAGGSLLRRPGLENTGRRAVSCVVAAERAPGGICPRLHSEGTAHVMALTEMSVTPSQRLCKGQTLSLWLHCCSPPNQHCLIHRQRRASCAAAELQKHHPVVLLWNQTPPLHSNN